MIQTSGVVELSRHSLLLQSSLHPKSITQEDEAHVCFLMAALRLFCHSSLLLTTSPLHFIYDERKTSKVHTPQARKARHSQVVVKDSTSDRGTSGISLALIAVSDASVGWAKPGLGIQK